MLSYFNLCKVLQQNNNKNVYIYNCLLLFLFGENIAHNRCFSCCFVFNKYKINLLKKMHNINTKHFIL